MNNSSSSSSSLIELSRDFLLRFEVELEFVSLLANPFYLQFLSQSKYFDRPEFLNYLTYLLYWKQPEYLSFLSHPHCLFFLDSLQDSNFRSSLSDPNFINFLHTQQFWHWRSFRFNRFMESQKKLTENQEENNQSQTEKMEITPFKL